MIHIFIIFVNRQGWGCLMAIGRYSQISDWFEKFLMTLKRMQGLWGISYKPLLDVTSNFNEICQKHFIRQKKDIEMKSIGQFSKSKRVRLFTISLQTWEQKAKTVFAESDCLLTVVGLLHKSWLFMQILYFKIPLLEINAWNVFSFFLLHPGLCTSDFH